MSNVRPVTRTVYHGGGRHWITRRAAYRAEATRMLRSRCECRLDKAEPDVGFYPGTCELCSPQGEVNSDEYFASKERWMKLRNRLARWMSWNDARMTREKP